MRHVTRHTKAFYRTMGGFMLGAKRGSNTRLHTRHHTLRYTFHSRRHTHEAHVVTDGGFSDKRTHEGLTNLVKHRAPLDIMCGGGNRGWCVW